MARQLPNVRLVPGRRGLASAGDPRCAASPRYRRLQGILRPVGSHAMQYIVVYHNAYGGICKPKTSNQAQKPQISKVALAAPWHVGQEYAQVHLQYLEFAKNRSARVVARPGATLQIPLWVMADQAYPKYG